jgi:hypothetical protein
VFHHVGGVHVRGEQGIAAVLDQDVVARAAVERIEPRAGRHIVARAASSMSLPSPPSTTSSPSPPSSRIEAPPAARWRR